ncbi:uncharacterized protein LOC115034801 [Acyrthosiphon pisum]|uniref:Reverse transcriptase/retrotransposon-derived protein RNase H-like domain-containing protein n=1 Tax=Acyrthosiphon pisum TaxID=7029 RepID=A0A8R2NUV0_ACYPI|nr:uncharacterized protein LOC115034801 [Acyrthosiphon pisum]
MVNSDTMEVGVGELPATPRPFLVEEIFTPSPTPSPHLLELPPSPKTSRPLQSALPQPLLPVRSPQLTTDPYEFVMSDPEFESPSGQVSPDLLGMSTEPMDVGVDSDEERIRPRRLNVAERNALNVDTQMVKYCPLCDFMTAGHKLGRHLQNRHRSQIKKPRDLNIRKICQHIASESRKSYSVVPLRVIEKKLGPYWDDRCFRSIAHELTTMGRIKTYGGSWNLPGVSDTSNPFECFFTDSDFGPDTLVKNVSATPAVPVLPIPETSGETIPIPGPSGTSGRPANPENITMTKANAPSSESKLRKASEALGLNHQLPSNHPLIVMFRKALEISHGNNSQAANNYVSNVSRVLCYVHQQLVANNLPPKHWADLVTADVEFYVDFFRRREEIGQTKATTINYMKNLRLLLSNIIKSFIYEDQSFPKGFDLLPCVQTVTNIKLLEHKLGLLYRRTTKQQPTELFARKTTGGENLPDYSKVVESIVNINAKWIWGDTQQQTFERIKQKFIEDIIIQFPDFDREFYLNTDASTTHLGAELYQINEEGQHQTLGLRK